LKKKWLTQYSQAIGDNDLKREIQTQ